ncbi:MAG: hypothetical protein HKP30_18505 [Myxococcales bacterium]|nr:hypothetical protein [Myxococcales bacterium]
MQRPLAQPTLATQGSPGGRFVRQRPSTQNWLDLQCAELVHSTHTPAEASQRLPGQWASLAQAQTPPVHAPAAHWPAVVHGKPSGSFGTQAYAMQDSLDLQWAELLHSTQMFGLLAVLQRSRSPEQWPSLAQAQKPAWQAPVVQATFAVQGTPTPRFPAHAPPSQNWLELHWAELVQDAPAPAASAVPGPASPVRISASPIQTISLRVIVRPSRW